MEDKKYDLVKAYDAVNHPKHYTFGKYEHIDVVEAFGLGYHLGNATKYMMRANHKGATIQDFEKALWYLNRAKNNPSVIPYRKINLSLVELNVDVARHEVDRPVIPKAIVAGSADPISIADIAIDWFPYPSMNLLHLALLSIVKAVDNPVDNPAYCIGYVQSRIEDAIGYVEAHRFAL